MARSATRFLHARLRLTGRSIAHDEQGMALMEVVASAALVAMLAVGLLTVFDVAGATSGTNKARAVAASIAQDDHERMRGLEVRALYTRGPETRTVKAGGVTYTVKSTADIVTDSVNEGCTTGAGGIDYLKIRTEVTWPNMRIDPVVAESLMAPKPGSFGPDEGGLSVQVVNRTPSPVEGVTVSLSGPGSFSDTTDANGCAFFTYIPAGDYTVTFSQPGKVTPAGVTNVSDPVGVPDGAISNKIFSYDIAARLTANFVTWTGSSASTAVADRGTSFAAMHSGVPAPGSLFFPSATHVASITSPTVLFPFTSNYSAYAGACVDARPSLFGAAATATMPTVSLGPGGSGTVNVMEPSLDVLVQSNGVAVNGATVVFYDNTCGADFVYPTTTGSDGAATGRLRYPGVPYGKYDVCAQVGGRYRVVTMAQQPLLNNNDPDRESITVNVRSSGTTLDPTGSCPAPGA